jgi:hypothetical protein
MPVQAANLHVCIERLGTWSCHRVTVAQVHWVAPSNKTTDLASVSIDHHSVVFCSTVMPVEGQRLRTEERRSMEIVGNFSGVHLEAREECFTLLCASAALWRPQHPDYPRLCLPPLLPKAHAPRVKLPGHGVSRQLCGGDRNACRPHP